MVNVITDICYILLNLVGADKSESFITIVTTSLFRFKKKNILSYRTVISVNFFSSIRGLPIVPPT